MPIYLWNAKARTGGKKAGELEAASPQAVILHLKGMGLVPGKVKLKPKDISELLPFLARAVNSGLVCLQVNSRPADP